jgi:hypothetical protein
MSNATLRNNFDSCVTLYQDFIKQTTKSSKTTPTVGISELKISAGGSKRKSEAVEDRYYTKAEYNALSANDKKELAAKRLKRGHKPGAKDSKISKTYKSYKGKTNADVIKTLKPSNVESRSLQSKRLLPTMDRRTRTKPLPMIYRKAIRQVRSGLATRLKSNSGTELTRP